MNRHERGRESMERGGDKEGAWGVEKSVFRAMQPDLLTSDSISAIIPDLVRLRFFADERFQSPDAIEQASSATMLRAIKNRIEEDEHSLSLMMLPLRRVQPHLVEKFQQRVRQEVSNREKTWGGLTRKEGDGGCSAPTNRYRRPGGRYGGYESFSSFSRNLLPPIDEWGDFQKGPTNGKPYFSKENNFSSATLMTKKNPEEKNFKTNQTIPEKENVVKHFYDNQKKNDFRQLQYNEKNDEEKTFDQKINEDKNFQLQNYVEKNLFPSTPEHFSEQNPIRKYFHEHNRKEKKFHEQEYKEKKNPNKTHEEKRIPEQIYEEKEFHDQNQEDRNFQERNHEEENVDHQSHEKDFSLNYDSEILFQHNRGGKKIDSAGVSPSQHPPQHPPQQTPPFQHPPQHSPHQTSPSQHPLQHPLHQTPLHYPPKPPLNSSLFERQRCFSTPPRCTGSPPLIGPRRGSYSSQEQSRDLRFIGSVVDDVITHHGKPPTDELVAELVDRCVVSARSAWLVRKCSSPQKKIHSYFKLLSSLRGGDVDDVMEKCHANKEWVERASHAFQKVKCETDRDEDQPNCDVIASTRSSGTGFPSLSQSSVRYSALERREQSDVTNKRLFETRSSAVGGEPALFKTCDFTEKKNDEEMKSGPRCLLGSAQEKESRSAFASVEPQTWKPSAGCRDPLTSSSKLLRKPSFEKIFVGSPPKQIKLQVDKKSYISQINFSLSNKRSWHRKKADPRHTSNYPPYSFVKNVSVVRNEPLEGGRAGADAMHEIPIEKLKKQVVSGDSPFSHLLRSNPELFQCKLKIEDFGTSPQETHVISNGFKAKSSTVGDVINVPLYESFNYDLKSNLANSSIDVFDQSAGSLPKKKFTSSHIFNFSKVLPIVVDKQGGNPKHPLKVSMEVQDKNQVPNEAQDPDAGSSDAKPRFEPQSPGSEFSRREKDHKMASISFHATPTPTPTSDGASTIEWCRKNKLSAQTEIALLANGYHSTQSIVNLSEDDVEKLSGLSWKHKAKLWVAIDVTLR